VRGEQVVLIVIVNWGKRSTGAEVLFACPFLPLIFQKSYQLYALYIPKVQIVKGVPNTPFTMSSYLFSYDRPPFFLDSNQPSKYLLLIFGPFFYLR
jgi:hypothetical protein